MVRVTRLSSDGSSFKKSGTIDKLMMSLNISEDENSTDSSNSSVDIQENLLDLDNHRNDNKQEERDKVKKTLNFRCCKCSKKFEDFSAFRNHTHEIHMGKIHPCHFCTMNFPSEESVIKHERMHTGLINLDCNFCDFRCKRFYGLQAHIKEVHGL